ncbi:Ferric-pseudobactin BN7/BN8 receptor [Pseudomonas reidholzensis]|uniref:Ferric-pseudobactin BN7/BN8 receptor n=1 Tax=Pseudomonas reidholzensis TaxID=1785162 RepID=A0A383RPE2_9PSED|nr:TonB-dependent receptor [Pseudomonas reidholzensis]SYX88892.1 Ferric-pseudobactin BN7/BN8 receptor [Pseudomonas reidholzensis]
MHRFTRLSPRLQRTPLSALLSASLLMPGGLLAVLPSQALAAQEQHFYQIPGGPLGEVLSRFAADSGVVVSFDSRLTDGLQSTGLQGSYDLEQGFALLLSGNGLHAVNVAANNYLLEVSTPAQGLELSATSISGKAPGSTTEGTGLYTTYASSSSTRLNLSPKETPQSLSVITRQRMDDQKLTGLTEVMEATTGVWVSRVGVGAENDTYWSRGFQINNFEIDGMPTASRLDVTTQNTAMYDRVEVVRGATGLISGSGTPSATVNLIRKRPTYEPQLSATSEAGSWDRYGLGMDVSGPLTDSGNVRGRLVLDYKQQHAWIDHLESQSQLIYGITEFDLSESTLLTVGMSYVDNQVDRPLRTGFQSRFSDGSDTHFSRSANSAPEWAYNNRALSNLFASLEHQFDNGWSGKLEVGHSQNDYDELINYMNGEIDRQSGAGAYLYPNRWSGKPRQDNLDAYLTGPLSLFGREHELIAGVSLSHYRENTPNHGGWFGPWTGYVGTIDNIFAWDGAGTRPDTSTIGKTYIEEKQYAAYLTGRFQLSDATHLILGGRVTDWKRTNEVLYYDDPDSNSQDQESRNGVFLPYTGLVYDLDRNWSLYASYTKIFNPQAYGIEDEGGKPLEPQEGTGYEVGVKGSFNDDKLNASLALFRLEQDNLAVYVQDNYYRAEQGTTTQGVEMELSGQLAEGWQASLGYAYSVSTDEDDERIVTQVPRHSLKTFTSYRLPGALERMTVGGGVNWQSKNGQDLHGVTQGSYAVASLMARYQIDDHLSASVNVNNLFDKHYYSYVDNWSVYAAPRNFMASVQYQY